MIELQKSSSNPLAPFFLAYSKYAVQLKTEEPLKDNFSLEIKKLDQN